MDGVRVGQSRTGDHLEAESDLLRVDDSAVVTDDSIGTQIADPTLAAGDAQLDLGGELRESHSPIRLQQGKNFAVDRIHIDNLSFSWGPGRELANTLPPVSHSLKRTQTRRRTPMSIDSATEANRTSENAHHDFDHVVDRRNSNSMKWQAGA